MPETFLYRLYDFFMSYFLPTFIPLMFYIVAGVEVIYTLHILFRSNKACFFRILLNTVAVIGLYVHADNFVHTEPWLGCCRFVIILFNMVIFSTLMKIRHPK